MDFRNYFQYRTIHAGRASAVFAVGATVGPILEQRWTTLNPVKAIPLILSLTRLKEIGAQLMETQCRGSCDPVNVVAEVL